MRTLGAGRGRLGRLSQNRLGGIAVGLNASGAQGYTAEVGQFLGRVSDPGTTRSNLYAAMINTLVQGGVWSKLDTLYMFAAATAATANTNLIAPQYTCVPSGAPTFTADRSYTGANSKWVDTTFVPSTAGGKYTLNSATIFVWCLTAAAQDNAAMGTVTQTDTLIYPRFSDNNTYTRVNDSVGVGSGVASGVGLVTASRTGATQFDVYKDGVSINTSANATTLFTSVSLVFLRDASTFYTGEVAAGGCGAGLTAAQQLTLYNALHVYLQAVAGVP